MDFFAHQTAARQLSRRLVLLFIMAVVAVVLAVDAVVLFALATFERAPYYSLTDWTFAHPAAFWWTTILVLATIGFASLYKTSLLSGGGGVVARAAGGERVTPDTTDPLRKRLLNVVEEMAIASGVPMPEVYVLEQESGINAFAAGHNAGNAAIAVTRGALETLERSELQGVIAHEFSHVLNGDMRLNIRLMGLIFGLLVIALVGRLVLQIGPRGTDRKNGGAAAAFMLAAFVVMVVGYVGLFFGRLIQAAVARGRESLADASAVQFTRDPIGLRGALVKIGSMPQGSRLLDNDADEVAHMLFAPGMDRLFATHPPLLSRIRALDPAFQEREFEFMRARLQARIEHGDDADEPQPTAARRLHELIGTDIAVTPVTVPQRVASPETAHFDLARSIRVSLPPAIVAAAGNSADATGLFFALATDHNVDARELQMAFIEHQLGSDVATRTRNWLPQADALNPMQRQPALLRLFPSIRQLPRSDRENMLACLNGMLQRQARVSIESYALRKLAQVHLRDGLLPVTARGQLALGSVAAELAVLFSVLARYGSEEFQAARAAYDLGMTALLPQRRPEYKPVEQWPPLLDAALTKLDRLQPAAKEQLIEAMVKTIASDAKLTPSEAELLRAVSAALHCPLPPFLSE